MLAATAKAGTAERRGAVAFSWLAYELVKSLYDQVARRIDAQENRIRATMTFATTVTFAALTVLIGPLSERNFGSTWFIAAMMNYALLMLAGTVATLVTETPAW
jgi:hypothetical protein